MIILKLFFPFYFSDPTSTKALIIILRRNPHFLWLKSRPMSCQKLLNHRCWIVLNLTAPHQLTLSQQSQLVTPLKLFSGLNCSDRSQVRLHFQKAKNLFPSLLVACLTPQIKPRLPTVLTLFSSPSSQLKVPPQGTSVPFTHKRCPASQKSLLMTKSLVLCKAQILRIRSHV